MKWCHGIVMVLVFGAGTSWAQQPKGAELKCPEGTIEKRAPTAQWCVRDDKRHGPYVKWQPGGQRVVQGSFEMGKKHGEWTYWQEDGRKQQEGPYRQGERDGKWTEWYANGRKFVEMEFAGGKQHGLELAWHSNGKKMWEGQWRGGKRCGPWKCWDDRGTGRSCPPLMNVQLAVCPGEPATQLAKPTARPKSQVAPSTPPATRPVAAAAPPTTPATRPTSKPSADQPTQAQCRVACRRINKLLISAALTAKKRLTDSEITARRKVFEELAQRSLESCAARCRRTFSRAKTECLTGAKTLEQIGRCR